jgi:hypothetical protein
MELPRPVSTPIPVRSIAAGERRFALGLQKRVTRAGLRVADPGSVSAALGR